LCELRTYQIKPKYILDFIALTNEKIHIRTSVSPLLGYFSTEIGGINQTVHFWEYESLSQRAKVRQELGIHVEWNKTYMDKIRKMLVSQTNSLLVPVNKLLFPSQPGTYEIRRYKTPAKVTENDRHAVSGRADATLVGVWKTILGADNESCVELWHYANIDSVVRNEPKQRLFESKLLVPLKFSPLQ